MTDPRLFLFVPATRLDRIESAWRSGTDAVIVDLEDAVADEDKDGARRALVAAAPERPVHVRVNATDTPFHAADRAALARLAAAGAVAGVVLPKAEAPAVVEAVAAALPAGVELVALVETPRGLRDVDALVATGAVARLAFGPADYCAALGVARSPEVLAHPRSVLAVAAAAGGLPSVVDGPYLGLDDDDGLRADTAAGRALGLRAKLCVHPRQVATVRAALAPTADEVAGARALLAAAAEHGGGAFRWQGEMVDGPVRARAEAVLAATSDL